MAKTLRELALQHLQELEAANAAYEQAQQFERNKAEVKFILKRLDDMEIPGERIPNLARGNVIVDGIEFFQDTSDYRDGIVIYGPCGECGRWAKSQWIYSFYDLGRQLCALTPDYYHEHNWSEMHATALPEPNQTETTSAEKLASSLLDFIHEAIANSLVGN